MANKAKIIDACAKTYLLCGMWTCAKKEHLRQFSDEDILPSKRQLREWRISGKIKERIKSGQMETEGLGLFTGSFVSGLRDSGVFQNPMSGGFRFNGNAHRNLVPDLQESKLPIKLSKMYKNNQINISKCGFLRLEVRLDKLNQNEYFGGLFAGCRLEDGKDGKWLVVSPKSEESSKRVVSALYGYKIAYELKNDHIYVSPFYGALFFGFMPIHSATRLVNVRKPAKATELALVYWSMLRKVGQRVAPPKAGILPFARSYATHWDRGMMKGDLRLKGVDLGVVGMSEGLRELMLGWIRHS